MREDVEAADNMMTSLGELLRTTLSVPASEEVTLRRELNMLELYLRDVGETWQPWFDVVFRPHTSGDGTNVFVNSSATILARLDTEYQTAVKKNDAATMDGLLADDSVLVTGSGKIYSKADLLREARSGHVVYEHQEDTAQQVRVWGDTAVITAKLWEKGTENGKPFDYRLWFTDTYLRTATGWRYVFGQSSLPVPKTSE